MPLVFRTQKDSYQDVEIVGAGVALAGGKSGVPVEQAATTMSELQNEKGEPLSGAALGNAARKFAEERGLEVSDVKNLEKLRREAGVPADRPPLHEVAREEYEQMFGGLEPVGSEPEEQAEGGPEAGEPDHPDAAAQSGQSNDTRKEGK